ncbi:LysR family transcriptional regulator [Shimia sp. R10_1]|uniref:LysR family transcriptional regulator n=1 Tax=Shimia sp. R10_1 TaxID=2821095 RepID=UPI001ADD31B8|nr:LysR family transcriptional regulator [Shimia sp. R10_1]MBO9474494.1 LysR family transcriptional regulator [Shimia sp. R10_1]
MNLTKLRYAVAVDRQGAISGAARALHVTQSAVTKALADVEQEVGVALFNRHARGVTTTAEGRQFIDRAARILADVDQLSADVSVARQSREQVLRIGVAPSSLEGLMSRAVWSLVSEHPDVRVHLRGTLFEAGLQLFRQGDIDALIGPARPLMAEAGARTEGLPPLKALFFVRRGHPLVGRAVLAEDMARFPLIVPETSGPYAEPIQHVMQQSEGDPLRRVHIMQSFTMAAGVIERSEAVGMVADSYAQSRQFRSRFEVLDFPEQDPLPMAVAFRSGGHHGRALGWFLQALQKFPPSTGVDMPKP